MQIPKKINILGIIYKVILVKEIRTSLKRWKIEEDVEDLVGYCSSRLGLILIRKDLGQQQKESVFIHEVLEAINEALDLNIKHENINRLEAALYQVLKQ